MPNNILQLDEEIKRRALEKRQEAAENFDENVTLTEDEKKTLAEMSKQENRTVITEGGVSIPIREYAAPLENEIAVASEDTPFKRVNVGDVVQSSYSAQQEARARALDAFRQFATSGDDLSDEDIERINNDALEALREQFRVHHLNADIVASKVKGWSLYKFAEVLPASFMSLYTTSAEMKANNFKARERLIATLVYLCTVGPEMDHLNNYVDNSHRLTVVTQRLMQCSVDLLTALKSEERMSEIADRAAEIDPPKDMAWEKYITGDPRQVHNAAAQSAAVYEEYVKAYTKLLDEYPESNPDNAKAREAIQQEIDESKMKVEVYSSICKLELLRDTVDFTSNWLKSNKRMKYAQLEREAINAIDKVRRCKQDLNFPVYEPNLAKNAKEMYKRYIAVFTAMLANYNSALIKLQFATKDDDSAQVDFPSFVQIDGVMEESVHHYFAMLLLIVYGRLLKRLTKNDATKRDALILDEYFILYCSMGTDTYLMDDVWALMKPLVEYAISTWPRPSAQKGSKK